MVAAAAKQRALMAGTSGMRDAGETYLPRYPLETAEAYRDRLKSSWLFNGYRKTVRDMAGRVFGKPVELGDTVDQRIADWSDNIDNAGHDLSTFARMVFEDGIDAGISYILVDSPRRTGTVTQAQAQSQGLRPYFVHLPVESLIGWKTGIVANATVLMQLRIMETASEPVDEFTEKAVPQIRVLDRTPGGVQVRLFRKADDKHGDWLPYDEPFMTGLTEITVVPFYANRVGFFQGAPLLDDLADVNIAHWQSQSDQRNIMHFARVPILFAAGRADSEGPLVISAGMATVSSDPAAKMQWVEHSGQAIGAGRQDLKDLEFQMEAHGLQIVAPTMQSATGAAIDEAKATSTLSMTADELKDALEQAMIWLAEYAGIPGEFTVAVNKDFGTNMMGAQELAGLLSAVNTGQLSRETFLREMARRGMVAADLDPDEEAERIEAESGGLMSDGA